MNATVHFTAVGARVPDDIWNMVFRLMHASGKSVANVSLVCKRFHALVLPLLFQRLNFRRNRLDHARATCRLMRSREEIRDYVQHVDIDWISWIDYRMVAGAAPPCIRQLLYHLPNLEALSLSGTIITSEGAMVLATRPNIRHLSISSSCRLERNLRHSLPGTKNRGLRKVTMGDLEHDDPEDLIAWLHLILGPDLRDLHILGGLGTRRFFIEALLQELVPGSLEKLHIEHEDGALIYEIVAAQQKLQHLHFYCSQPPPVVDSRLPPALQSWSGPSSLATCFIPGSHIDSVKFWMQHDDGGGSQTKYDELMPMYHDGLKLAKRPIRSLEMLHIQWDQCIVECIPQFFPSLERLSVFLMDRPDMDYLEEVFPTKLATMQRLHYLALHTEATTPTLRPVEDITWLYGCLQRWSAHCPSLRQVECRAVSLWIDWVWLGPGDWKGFMKGDPMLDEAELVKLHIYPW